MRCGAAGGAERGGDALPERAAGAIVLPGSGASAGREPCRSAVRAWELPLLPGVSVFLLFILRPAFFLAARGPAEGVRPPVLPRLSPGGAESALNLWGESCAGRRRIQLRKKAKIDSPVGRERL